MKKYNLLAIISLLILAASCEMPDNKNETEKKIDVMEAWQSGPDLVTGVFGGSLIAHNNYLYLFGGVVDFTINYTTKVQRAKINEDGSLGAWEITDFSLPYVSAGHYSFVRDTTVYIINTLSGDIYAPINENDTIGTWEYLARGNRPDASSIAVYNDFLFRLGGWIVFDETAHKSINTVYTSEILEDGTITSWETDLDLTLEKDYFGNVVYGGYLYIFGGHYQNGDVTMNRFLNTVESSQINTDGSLAGWESQTSLPINAHSITPIVYKDNVYLFSRDLSYVIFAELKEGGQIGEWKTSSTNFPLGVHHSACLNGKFVYILGGIIEGDDNGTGSKKVYYTSFLE